MAGRGVHSIRHVKELSRTQPRALAVPFHFEVCKWLLSARLKRFFVSQLRSKAEALTCLFISAVLNTDDTTTAWSRQRRGVHPGAPQTPPFCCFSAFLLSVAAQHCILSALAVELMHSTQTDVKRIYQTVCAIVMCEKGTENRRKKGGRRLIDPQAESSPLPSSSSMSGWVGC